VLTRLHLDGSWVVILANAVAGVWCLGAHWVPALRVRALWWLVVGAQAMIFVQAIQGAWLIGVDGRVAPSFHTFYGFVAIVTVLLLYTYRSQLRAWQYLLYGFGSLFLMGLGIRAQLLA
jgi:hypothetical protein